MICLILTCTCTYDLKDCTASEGYCYIHVTTCTCTGEKIHYTDWDLKPGSSNQVLFVVVFKWILKHSDIRSLFWHLHVFYVDQRMNNKNTVVAVINIYLQQNGELILNISQETIQTIYE